MAEIVDEIRKACAWVAERARQVEIVSEQIGPYAQSLPLARELGRPDPDAHVGDGSRERKAAFWLTLDAINFGSGWFPTLRKRPGASGYLTVATGLKERFDDHGPFSADELRSIRPAEVARVLGQDAEHELMGHFARSLNDLGAQIEARHGGSWTAAVDAAGGSAVTLAEQLSGWSSFADASRYDGRSVPFLKRAQIAAADLARAGVAGFADVRRLTMFADNLVPHVLRLDGVLRFDAELVRRIHREELIEPGSPEEVEIRACAVHAVELIATARPDSCAADIDQVLWRRGGEALYKAVPRHRSRTTAY